MTNERISQLANDAMGSVFSDDDEEYASARGAIEHVIKTAISEATAAAESRAREAEAEAEASHRRYEEKMREYKDRIRDMSAKEGK